jgi:hypothetical protein
MFSVVNLPGDGRTYGVQISMRHCQDFHLKTGQIAKSSGFKSSKDSSQSAEVRNSANSRQAVLALWTNAESKKDIFSVRICPLDLGEYIRSQKLMVGIGIDMFDSESQPSVA